jgi:hypothetical protein
MYIVLPDRFQDQLAELEGKEAAVLVRKAASGDRRSLTALQNMATYANNPYFARALIDSLGVADTLKLTAELAVQLRTTMNGGGTNRIKSAIGATRAVLSTLATALQTVTSPNNGSPPDPSILRQLTTAGRTHFTLSDGDTVYGYQALSSLLDALSPKQGLSVDFVSTVGRDMVDFDRTMVSAAKRSGGLDSGPYALAPLGDMSGHYQFQGVLSGESGSAATAGATDFLIPLLEHCTSAASAQALLDYTSSGQNSHLVYLVNGRIPVWMRSDHGAALGGLLLMAMSGSDPESTKLFDQLTSTLGPTLRKWIATDNIDHLKVVQQGGLDQISGMRVPLANLLAARLDSIGTEIYATQVSGGGVPGTVANEKNLGALLAFAVSDDSGFWALAKAQVGLTKTWLNQQLDRGVGADVGLTQEATILGFILAFRQGMLTATTKTPTDPTLDLLKQFIAKGVGYIPVPYVDHLGEIKGDAESFVHDHYLQVGDWLLNKAAAPNGLKGPANPSDSAMSNAQAIKALLNQILISAAVQHLHYTSTQVAGKSFAADGRIIPPEQWNNQQTAAFLDWCNEQNISVPNLSNNAQTAINNSRDDALSLFIRATGSASQ